MKDITFIFTGNNCRTGNIIMNLCGEFTAEIKQHFYPSYTLSICENAPNCMSEFEFSIKHITDNQICKSILLQLRKIYKQYINYYKNTIHLLKTKNFIWTQIFKTHSLFAGGHMIGNLRPNGNDTFTFVFDDPISTEASYSSRHIETYKHFKDEAVTAVIKTFKDDIKYLKRTRRTLLISVLTKSFKIKKQMADNFGNNEDNPF